MKVLHAVVVAALSLGLSGCVASEQQFVQYRQIMRQRPDLRAKMMSNCVHDIDRDYKGQKREAVAALIDAKASTLPATSCKRMLGAYLSGRLTYQDYRSLSSHNLSVRVVRILRGK